VPEAASNTRLNLNRRTLIGVGLGFCLAVITLALYWQVRSFDFITAYDDQKYVTENPMVRNGLSPEGVSWAFTTGYASNWHPLTWVSHMLDVELWGLNSGAHHLVNLFLHVANACLLLVVLWCFTGSVWRSAVVAALFAWHPLHVESVAWVAERKDVLSTLFLMLTLLAYRGWAAPARSDSETEMKAKATRKRKAFYAVALIAFALGLMSKPMLVTAPFVLLLLDYWPLERHLKLNWGQLALEKIPFLVLSAASSVVTFLVQQAGGAVATLGSLPLSERAASAIVAYGRYLGKAFWPQPLAIPYPFVPEWPVHVVLGALLLLVAVSVAVWVWRRPFPYLPVGWFWFLGTLVPVIGLVQIGGQSMADRYTYVPLIGVFVMIVWGTAECSARCRWGRGAGIAAAAVVLLLCVGATRKQLPHWRNSVELFQHAAAVTANNATAHVNLGKALAEQGKLQEALAQYQAGLTIRPTDAEALNDVGNLCLRAGKPAAALEFYQRAVALKPADASFHYNTGNARAELGQSQAALEAYEQALRLNPGYARAHTALAVKLVRLGRMQEAWQHLTRSAELDPNIAETHNLLGNFQAAGEKHEQAVAAYREALRLDPRMAGVCLNLGNSLLRLGRTNDAIAAWEHGVKLSPGMWQAHARLAEVHASLGSFPRAVESAERALKVAADSGLTTIAEELRQRLAKYRAGQK
jgi:tetratricopeptide (TPR) repeat protein